MNRLSLKVGLFCWIAGNALLFVVLMISPVGKVAAAFPVMLRLHDLIWPLFYRGSIL